jgi:hypothetical protein
MSMLEGLALAFSKHLRLNAAETLEGKWAVAILIAMAVVAVAAKEVVEISEGTIIKAVVVAGEVVVVEDTRTAGAKTDIRTMKTEEIATRGAEVEVDIAVAIKEETTTGEMMDGKAVKAGRLLPRSTLVHSTKIFLNRRVSRGRIREAGVKYHAGAFFRQLSLVHHVC